MTNCMLYATSPLPLVADGLREVGKALLQEQLLEVFDINRPLVPQDDVEELRLLTTSEMLLTARRSRTFTKPGSCEQTWVSLQ